MTTFEEFVELVEEMRHAQREYFRTRRFSTLEQARRAEKKVDAVCARLRTGQQELFKEP